MEIVLGVSVAPATVRMVLVEGENADGVVLEQDDFGVAEDNAQAPTTSSVLDRVVSAILGTREGATEGGYRLASTGVTVTDQVQAAMLRDALAAHKVENVMLVSAFLAAAALTQLVGGSIGYGCTALMFVEPDSATLAMVDSADGSIADVRRRSLSSDDAVALAELTTMVSGIGGSGTRPGGVFVVGSENVDVVLIKPALEATTSLPVNVPEEPELALARGAALASANAPLFSSSTQALAWAQDPETGEVDPELVALGYSYVPAAHGTGDEAALAYSADPDYTDDTLTTVLDLDQQRRMPFLLAASALATLFVVGVAALVIALAADMRPNADRRPDAGQHIVVPTKPAPSTSAKAEPAPPPSSTPPPPPPSPPPSPPSPPPSSAAPPRPVQQPSPVAPKAPQQRRTPEQPAPAPAPPPSAAPPPPAPAPPPPAPPPPPPPPAPPPPPPPPPPQPAMPPMTMWLHLPFLSIPIPINPPAPPPPP